jgi:hypothetical protein
VVTVVAVAIITEVVDSTRAARVVVAVTVGTATITTSLATRGATMATPGETTAGLLTEITTTAQCTQGLVIRAMIPILAWGT